MKKVLLNLPVPTGEAVVHNNGWFSSGKGD